MTEIRPVRFTSLLERSDNRLWGAHIAVPPAVAEKFDAGGGGPRRVVCSLNASEERQCAIVPAGRGKFVITVNKSLREKLGLAFGDPVEAAVRPDTSKYGLPLPGEFAELLRQDREGNRLFHALTPGRQRTLLYMIGAKRTSDVRIARSLVIVHHLKLNHGKINYRKLGLELRGPAHRPPRAG